MNEPSTTDRDDLFLCPECFRSEFSGIGSTNSTIDTQCRTCHGTGVIDRATLEDRRQDAKANDENWKDGE